MITRRQGLKSALALGALRVAGEKPTIAKTVRAEQSRRKIPGFGKEARSGHLSNLHEVPEAVRAGVRDNLGSHWNHSRYWDILTPGGAKQPSGDLKVAIEAAFSSVAAMSDKAGAAGVARFGSG